MITLASGSTVQGSAGSATSITVSIFGDELVSGVDSFKKLYQGQLPTSAGVLYTVTSATHLIKSIILCNTTAGAVLATLFIDGVANVNRIFQATIPANGLAAWSGDGWKVLDSTGALTTSMTGYALATRSLVAGAGLVGGGDLSADRTFDVNPDNVGIEVVSDTVALKDGGVTNARLATMAQSLIKGRAAAAGTGAVTDLTGTQVKTILAVTSTDLSDFVEAAQDAVGSLLADSATLDVTYNDAGNAETARTLNPFISRVTAASKTYAVTDNGQWYERINGGSAMTDTLPTPVAADNGITIGVHNKGTTVAETITFTGAGGEVIGDVATSYVLQYGCRQTFIWTGTKWLFGSGNANLTKSPTSAPAVNNFATYADTSGRQLTAATPAQAKTILAIANTDVSGLGTLSTQNGTFSGTSSGTNTGDQTISLTGPVTGSGTGSFATTIANDAVDNTKLANMSAATFKGQILAGSGDPVDMTAAQAKAALAIANTDVSGLGTLSTQSGTFSGTHSGTSSGTNTGDQTISLTGDVTGSGTGSFSTTIANGVVALTKLANASPNSVKGDFTGGVTSPQYLPLAANTFPGRSSSGNVVAKTISDSGFAFIAASSSAAETALLDVATTALKGLLSAADKIKLNGAYTDIVADSGADPTGTVDATTIIQNALNAFGAGGGRLYFPAGTYKVSANITISKPVILCGAGRAISVINMITATGDIFTLTTGSQGAGFEQLRISANTAGLRTAGYAVDFGAIPNVYIQQCDILFQWSGVKSSGALQFLDDVNIREMGANAINGNSILIASTGDRYLRRLTMDQAARTVDFAGIRVNECSSLVISDSNIIHCGTALHVNANAGAGHAVASVYAVNTFLDTSVIGANITCATGSDTVQRVTFVRSWFSTHSTAGVQINHANVNSVDFIGCEFYQEPFGIDVTACTEWGVRSSRFAGCTTNAIRTAAGSTHSFTISDNVIGNVAGFGANAQGINIQAGTYARYAINDNRGLDTNTTPGIIDLGVVPVTGVKNVSNNLGALVKGALQLVSSGAAAVIAARGTATSGTTETLLFAARIPANGVSVGQTFRISLMGQSSSTGTVIFKIRAGPAGTVAGDTLLWTATTSGAQVANATAVVEGLVTVVALGASANVVGGGRAIVQAAVLAETAAAEVIATAPTTAAWFISITCTDALGTFTVRQGAVEAL